jgi:hypothetical protein
MTAAGITPTLGLVTAYVAIPHDLMFYNQKNKKRKFLNANFN